MTTIRDTHAIQLGAGPLRAGALLARYGLVVVIG